MDTCLYIIVVAMMLGTRGADTAAAASSGEAIVAEHCTSCHAVESQSDTFAALIKNGPPLVYAGSKFRREWLVSWLQAPQRLRPGGYLSFRYTVPTPNGDCLAENLLPQHPLLSRPEAEAVAEYFASRRKELGDVADAGITAGSSGALQFRRTRGCAGCHRLGSEGGLSAPELTNASDRLDPTWLRGFLLDPPHWAPTAMPKIGIGLDDLGAIQGYIEQAGWTKTAVSSCLADAVAVPKVPQGRPATLYGIYCAQCHGVRGNGQGINAPYLIVAPRNLTSAEEMGMLTDERLFAAIKFGGAAVGKSPLMPSWGGTIADSDISLLVDFVRQFTATRIASGRSKE